ncbi:HAD-IA family hydrolase [Gynuella sp.]|uniref:HAD-IA family hydrolase n=1 Tax=Gynuella sp. TaxID=2969146 RepID=UPI003D118B96
MNFDLFQTYDALIFDMDGTLVESGPLHEEAWTRTLKAFGLPIIKPMMRALCGVPTKETLEIIAQKTNTPLRVSVTEMNDFKETIAKSLMHDYVKPTPIADIARYFYGKKPMAVGTGAYTEEAKAILTICGLDHLFNAIVGADQVANPKPAPDVFLRGAELTGATPEKCAVFEDAELGLQAARAANMTAYDVHEHFGYVNEYFLD